MKDQRNNEHNLKLTNEQVTTLNNALVAYLEQLEVTERKHVGEPRTWLLQFERGIVIRLLDDLDHLESDKQNHSYLPGTSYDY